MITSRDPRAGPILQQHPSPARVSMLFDLFSLSLNCIYHQGPSLGFFHCTIGFLCDIIGARAGNICTRSNMNALSGLQPPREQFLLQKFSHSGACRCGEAVFPLAGITNAIYHVITHTSILDNTAHGCRVRLVSCVSPFRAWQRGQKRHFPLMRPSYQSSEHSLSGYQIEP